MNNEESGIEGQKWRGNGEVHPTVGAWVAQERDVCLSARYRRTKKREDLEICKPPECSLVAWRHGGSGARDRPRLVSLENSFSFIWKMISNLASPSSPGCFPGRTSGRLMREKRKSLRKRLKVDEGVINSKLGKRDRFCSVSLQAIIPAAPHDAGESEERSA